MKQFMLILIRKMESTQQNHFEHQKLGNWVVGKMFEVNIFLEYAFLTFSVGDFVFLRNNDNIPADIIIISTSEPDSTCYVETKNLDGETNLKIKRGLPNFSHIRTPEDCHSIYCHIDSEPPNSNLYSYNGTLVMRSPPGMSDEKQLRTNISIGPTGLLLRGCILRNTRWLIGIAVYTGTDTKIVLNSGETPSKRSRIDRQLNGQV